MLSKEVAFERQKIINNLRGALCVNSPGFAALAMWIPTYAVDRQMVACTDGKLIYLGNKFFESEFSVKNQTAIIIHEMLHIVFCHIQRFNKLEKKYHTIHNLSTDCIINFGISQIKFVQLPKDCVTFDSLLKDDPIQYRISNSEWTSESLYEYLLKNKVTFINDSDFGDGLSGDLDPSSSNIAKEEGIEVPDYVKELDQESEEVQREIWNKRLERAKQGDSPDGILRKLDKEFPKSKVDWRKPLRQYANQYLKPQRLVDWSKCSRRMMSTQSVIFTPGSKKSKAINRMGLIIDTSGSIDQEQLMQFLTEVDSIQGFASAELILIYADADVAAKYVIKRTETSIVKQVQAGGLTPAGGGGSVFYPALEELSKHDIDVAIYLTDMYGDFGAFRPKFPVIWAATSQVKGPYGKTIYIE